MGYFNFKPLVVSVIAENYSDGTVLEKLKNIPILQQVVIYRSKEGQNRWGEKKPNKKIKYVLFSDQQHLGDPCNSMMHFTYLHSVDFDYQNAIICRSVPTLDQLQNFWEEICHSLDAYKISENFMFISKFPDSNLDVEDLMLDSSKNTWLSMTNAIKTAYKK